MHAAIRALLPITEFTHFHGDPNLNYQLNRFLIPGSQELFAELGSKIRQLGGDLDEGGTTAGALHRGWVSVKGTLTGYSDYAMLDECERGEDVALANYRKALKQALPAAARVLVEKQSQGAQRNHDQIKAMRDALKVSA